MFNLARKLFRDEAGFVVSAELVLVATICVLGLVVGLSELSIGVNEELEDLGAAVGSANQSYTWNGAKGTKGYFVGSCFTDRQDQGDCEGDISCNVAPQLEGR